MTFEPFDGPLTSRPTTHAEVVAMFGDPTRGGLYEQTYDPKWYARSIVELHGDSAFLPVLAASYFPIHRLIEPYAREAFKRAESVCPGYIERRGTWAFNFRHMRHDVRMPLSYHSWGIAIDINPDDNAAAYDWHGEPWDAEWMAKWPHGLPQGVVEAFESCGFAWGGRWKGFVDPMHAQWLGPSGVQV